MKFTYHNSFTLSDSDFQKRLKQFKSLIQRDDLGFYRLTDSSDFLTEVKALADKFSEKKAFVQVGIGGSALGPEMLIDALSESDKTFLLFDNTDSDYLSRQLKKLHLKDTLFYVVSKSGGTAETLACYSIIRNELKKNGITDFENYFVFCTDPSQGELRSHVDEFNYQALNVPSNIGGRFSVLSPVGLLPAYFMGINIDKLFEGANQIKKQIEHDSSDQNDLIRSAECVFQAYEKGFHETVMMPYSSLLKSFSAWFVQLWAESLGKNGPAGPVGLTPIAAYGATDQHSQVQLFMEGPNNKFLFLLNVKNKGSDFSLDSGLELSRSKKLAPYTMNQLLEAEFQGNLQALKEQNRPIIEIELKTLDEISMGAMIMFFESLTALMGEYFNIDAFNQPGVEKGKIYAFQYLDSQQ